jgi:HK97 gp10 family phage protein
MDECACGSRSGIVSGVTIDASEFGKFAERLRALKLASGKGIKEVGIKSLANVVRTNAVKMILRVAPEGKPYTRYNPTRTGIASAPGQPPHSDTGELANGINIREIENGYAVVSSAPYSSYLEYGTKDMEARPFMYPALAQALPELTKIIKQAWLAKRRDIGKLT